VSRRILALAVASLAAATPFALATATATSAQRPNAAVEIGSAKIAPLGTVLVSGRGRPLYVFHPDGASRIACTPCQKIWFPLLAPATGVARAIGAARQSLIGSTRDPVIGRRVVTYDGWPLYTYVLDRRPGQADGQNIAMGGGHWRVLTPAGRVDSTPVSHGGGYAGS